MINIKNHAKQRYCERILGMTDIKEIKQYIVQNEDNINTNINKMYDYSKYIYRGSIGDNITRIYHLVDNVVLVLDSQKSCIITMYKCIFDFGEKMDRELIKHLVSELDELHEELQVIESNINEFVEAKEVKKETIEAQMKALEEQLSILKKQHSFVKDEISCKMLEKSYTVKEIEKRAVRIVNSIEYRNDLKEKAI